MPCEADRGGVNKNMSCVRKTERKRIRISKSNDHTNLFQFQTASGIAQCSSETALAELLYGSSRHSLLEK